MLSDTPEDESVTVMVKLSVTVSPASSAVVSASELSSVYVHDAPDIAMLPYVPADVPAAYERDESASSSTPATVPVDVVVWASSVTAPVWSAPALVASSAPVTVTVTVMVSVPPLPSVTVIVKASVAVSPASSAVVSASELSRVYVQDPPDMARLPYVPVALPTE